jgi:serine phosphatase RsbU (regulator of sigma subunit)
MFFGSEQLLATVQANLGRSAEEIEEAILTAVHQFAGGVSQFDDVALIVVGREWERKNKKQKTENGK